MEMQEILALEGPKNEKLTIQFMGPPLEEEKGEEEYEDEGEEVKEEEEKEVKGEEEIKVQNSNNVAYDEKALGDQSDEEERKRLLTKEYNIKRGKFNDFFTKFTRLRFTCNENGYNLEEPEKCLKAVAGIYDITTALTEKEKHTALEALIDITDISGDHVLAANLVIAWKRLTGRPKGDFLRDKYPKELHIYDLVE